MGIKRRIDSIKDKFTNKIDDKMINYISRFVYKDATSLENAISIYLALGDILCYSPYFCLTHDYNKTNMVRDINEENNEMICKNWAILYYRLLKYFGIKSKIDRSKSHYKVEMHYNDVDYSIDATGYGGTAYFYSLSDTTRIKCNLKIERFLVTGIRDKIDISKFSKAVEELNIAINNVYKRQNRIIIPDAKYDRLKNKTKILVEQHGRVVGVGSEVDINYRIKVINRYWGLNIIDSAVEKIQLFNSFYKSIFSDYDMYEYQSKCYNIYAYKNHKLVIYKLIALEINGIYYYYLDDGKKFNYYSKDDLLKEFNKRNIRITEFTDIIGLLIHTERYKIKMK